MAKTDEAEDAQQGTEDEQGSDREETVGPPPFAKGWRWPLIFLVVGIVALAAFVTLLTSPTELLPRLHRRLHRRRHPLRRSSSRLADRPPPGSGHLLGPRESTR